MIWATVTSRRPALRLHYYRVGKDADLAADVAQETLVIRESGWNVDVGRVGVGWGGRPAVLTQSVEVKLDRLPHRPLDFLACSPGGDATVQVR